MRFEEKVTFGWLYATNAIYGTIEPQCADFLSKIAQEYSNRYSVMLNNKNEHFERKH